MTINIISDLHCRNKSFPPSFDPKKLEPADVLVVAGDLGTRPSYDKIEQKINDETKGKFKSVFCIKGNHDYYSTDPHWTKRQKTMEWPSESDNKILPVDDDCVIVGTTLWSPIFDRIDDVRNGLNDYNYIFRKGEDGICQSVTTDHITDTFWKNLQWLEKTVDDLSHSRKVVVVTHHLPLPELIEERFRGDAANEAFCVLDPKAVERIRRINTRLWIHGHSHAFLDMTVDGTRYIRNPYGYEWTSHDYGTSRREDTGFVMNTIVEI